MTASKTIRADLRWAGLRFEDPKTLDLGKVADDIELMRTALKRAANYLDMDEELAAALADNDPDELRCNNKVRDMCRKALTL